MCDSLRKVSTSAGLLSAIRLGDAERISESWDACLQIKLRWLGQVRLLSKIIQIEEGGAPFHLSLHQSGRSDLQKQRYTHTHLNSVQNVRVFPLLFLFHSRKKQHYFISQFIQTTCRSQPPPMASPHSSHGWRSALWSSAWPWSAPAGFWTRFLHGSSCAYCWAERPRRTPRSADCRRRRLERDRSAPRNRSATRGLLEPRMEQQFHL